MQVLQNQHGTFAINYQGSLIIIWLHLHKQAHQLLLHDIIIMQAKLQIIIYISIIDNRIHMYYLSYIIMYALAI